MWFISTGVCVSAAEIADTSGQVGLQQLTPRVGVSSGHADPEHQIRGGDQAKRTCDLSDVSESVTRGFTPDA